MNLTCYKVICKAEDGSEIEHGVMTTDEAAAKRIAENSLLEGRHIKAKAIRVEETDGI